MKSNQMQVMYFSNYLRTEFVFFWSSTFDVVRRAVSFWQWSNSLTQVPQVEGQGKMWMKSFVRVEDLKSLKIAVYRKFVVEK